MTSFENPWCWNATLDSRWIYSLLSRRRKTTTRLLSLPKGVRAARTHRGLPRSVHFKANWGLSQRMARDVIIYRLVTSRMYAIMIGRRREPQPISSRTAWNSNGTRSLESLSVVTTARRRQGWLWAMQAFLKLGIISCNSVIKIIVISFYLYPNTSYKSLLVMQLRKR